MIITTDDFFEMGFAADDSALLERCIKRAEFVLNGLTGGRAGIAVKNGGEAAELVKQAAAFQTNAILREELASAARKNVLPEKEESNSDKTGERVSIGDFSYSTDTASSSSVRNSSAVGDTVEYVPLDHDKTVVRLLRAAGCLYCGTEVLE